MGKKKKQVKYSFPTQVRCPRCGSIQTRSYSTHGKIQYRKCQAPVCRHRFSVRGEAVKQTTKQKGKDNGTISTEAHN